MDSGIESAEAAFQGQKEFPPSTRTCFTGNLWHLPRGPKRLGNMPIDVGEWNARRLSVMRMVVRDAKFEPRTKLQQLLLAATEPNC